MESVPVYVCRRCSQRAQTVKALFRHLTIWHSHESNWSCSFDGCARTYRLYSSFKKHVDRHHSHIFDNASQSNSHRSVHVGTTPEVHQGSTDEPLEYFPGVSTSGTCLELPSSLTCHERDPVEQLSLLVLKWKEQRQLPESTVNEICNDIIDYLGTLREQPSSQPYDFSMLATRRQREKYWTSALNYIPPVTVPLPNAEGRCKRDRFEYVPICDVISALMQAETYKTGDRASNILLQDVYDGCYFKSHPVFGQGDEKIIIQLYFDEFEVCNPIGSKRGKHKILAGYFTLLNTPLQCRSKVNDKHLVLLAKMSSVNSHGLKKIMEPLVNDIKRLETEGILVRGRRLTGTVLYITGDNLASHQIGGFRMCFSSGAMCRFCMATRDEINLKWEERDFTPRTPSAHARHVTLVESDPSLSKVYGVNRESCLNELSSYDATRSLPPDIMHDLFEGVIPFVLKHVVKKLVTDGVITLAMLNSRLERFKFQGNDKKSQPPRLTRAAIFGCTSITGSASEKWCLFRFFSFLVGDIVPPDNEAFDLYLCLRDIVDIVAAPQLTPQIIPFLQVQITDFFSSFTEVFPNVPCIPKMHFMIHYPKLILMYGPLSRLSSIRFEAKHQYFKSLARKTHNFVNICRSLSKRHQMNQMYTIAQPVEEMVTSGCRRVPYETLPQLLKKRLEDVEMDNEEISSLLSITVKGRSFRVGCVIPVRVFDDDLPDFAHVTLILVCKQRLFVHCQLLDTKAFDEHFHAFVVERKPEAIVIEDCEHYSEFPDLVYLYEVCNRTYVNLRYTMFTGMYVF
ncbi:uncharacterized protein LOC135388470 [Ornithodoros turicata]|uniref:uncharacterized protein LOC135388470 n=1 Tax=Ornithodoros turicata TaxID=34597 RepID=UPI003138EB6D